MVLTSSKDCVQNLPAKVTVLPTTYNIREDTHMAAMCAGYWNVYNRGMSKVAYWRQGQAYTHAHVDTGRRRNTL